jgi:peptidoglycan/LPS O-acetylase OafA/YrhL
MTTEAPLAIDSDTSAEATTHRRGLGLLSHPRSIPTTIRTFATPKSRAPSSSGSSGGLDIPSLNGIRALAVTVVFFGHAGINAMPGPLFVTVFFFLSGYLITTLMRMEFEKTGAISFKAFYLRRAFRILPPLYLVLILAVVMCQIGVFTQKLRASAVLAQFFFLSNWQILHGGWNGPNTGRPPGTGSLWSLAVEEWFYLIFPLVFLALCRFVPSARRKAMILGGLCGLILVWRLILMFGLHASFDRTYVGTDTRFDSLLFGCILAVWQNPFLDPLPSGDSFRARAGRLWAPVLAPIGVIGMALAYGKLSQLGPVGQFFNNTKVSGSLQYTIEGLCLIPIFVVAVRYAHRGVFRAFNWRPVVFIGALSYSIYISHEIVIAALHDHVPPGHVERGVLYVIVTLVFCYVVYRVVERPFGKLRRRLSRTGPLSTARPAPRPELPTALQPELSTPQSEPVRDGTLGPALVMSVGTDRQPLVSGQIVDAADVTGAASAGGWSAASSSPLRGD